MEFAATKTKKKLAGVMAVAALMFSSVSPAAAHGDPYDTWSDWCGDIVSTLRDAERNSDRQAQMGYFNESVNTLYRGLVAASKLRPSPLNGPLTARSTKRGVELAKNLTMAVVGKANAAQTLHVFLKDYYDFVREVAYDIDIRLYIPYRRNHNDGALGNREYETRYVIYIQRQLQMVVNSLAEEGTRHGREVVYPLGSDKAFLTAAEVVTRGAADDLEESVWAPRYACVHRGLQALAYQLWRFNTGKSSTFHDPVSAVFYSYYDTKEYADQLEQFGGCR
jgi:hypothetical protein